MIDYMEIYKKYDRTISPKENHGLDAASTQVLGINKIKYDGTLQDLYNNDYNKYVFYNAVDAALVTLIHRKLKTVNTILSVAALNNLTIYKASSAVNLTEALMFKKFYQNNMVIADDYSEKPKGNYEGAYVKQPIPGLYESIACFDFASLYPSVMRQINISPEVFVEKLEDENEIIERRKDKSVIVSSTGAVFKNEGDSVLKQVLAELYGERKTFKNRHLFLEIELVKLKETLNNK
jgi:DNA polymerase elongation subunit (family B)